MAKTNKSETAATKKTPAKTTAGKVAAAKPTNVTPAKSATLAKKTPVKSVQSEAPKDPKEKVSKPVMQPEAPNTSNDVEEVSLSDYEPVQEYSGVRLAERPRVRYSDKDLEFFRQHILDERKKSVEEFQILRENLDDITNSEMADENASYSMHMAEQGTNAQEKEKIYAHVQRLSDYIKKLDEALQRIDDKVYGICKMCGILIAKERLLAVPITTQSASYKITKKCPDDGIDRITPLKK